MSESDTFFSINYLFWRQSSSCLPDNKSRFILLFQCVHTNRVEKAFRKLDVDAFEQGPPPSGELSINEGQVMWLDFRGNIQTDPEVEGLNRQDSLKLAYNTHIKNKLSFVVTEIDKFAQKSLECYRGFVRVWTRGMLEKSVPKEDSEGSNAEARSRGTKNQPMKTIFIEGDVLLAELLINLAKVSTFLKHNYI